jgi:hypothetical protein
MVFVEILGVNEMQEILVLPNDHAVGIVLCD